MTGLTNGNYEAIEGTEPETGTGGGRDEEEGKTGREGKGEV